MASLALVAPDEETLARHIIDPLFSGWTQEGVTINVNRNEQPIARAILLHMWNLARASWSRHIILRLFQLRQLRVLPQQRLPPRNKKLQNLFPREYGQVCGEPITPFNWRARAASSLSFKCWGPKLPSPVCAMNIR